MNCSIYPINPFTGKDSTLYKELFLKIGNREEALIKYGEYFNKHPELFKKEEEPSLSFFESPIESELNVTLNEVIDDIEHLKNVFKKAGVEMEVSFSSDLIGKGKIINNKIELNPKYLTGDTVYHEFAHAYLDLLGYNSPIIKRAVYQLKDTELAKRIKSQYPELNEDELNIEILSQAIGEEKYKNESFINRIFRFIGELLGITPNAARSLYMDLYKGNLKPFTGTLSSTEKFQKTNSNSYIDLISNQSKIVDYNEETKEYTVLGTNEKPNRVSSIVQYFTGREAKLDFTEEDLAKKEADKFWENLAKDKKQLIDNKELDYNEFVKYRISTIKLGAIKGNAIHSWLQYAASGEEQFRKKALGYEALTLGLGQKGGAIDYSWANDHSKAIFKNAGILLQPFGSMKADIIKPEVKLSNSIIKAAGTADMIVYHDDNTVSILDWKTGRNFNLDVFSKILEYGSQTKLITDNAKNRAKLQIALYAFIIKLNNPDIQFKNLKVCHIPSSHSASQPFIDADVNMNDFLPMLETLFRDKKFLELSGLSLDTYRKIKEASPRAFIVGDYQSISTTAYSELKDKGISTATATKITDINYLSNKAESERLTKEEQRVLANSTRELLEMENLLNIKLPKEVPADYEIGLITKLTGTYMDTNNPYLQSLKVLQDKRMDLASKKYGEVETKFYKLLNDVIKEDPNNSPGKSLGKYNFTSNPNFWDWAYREVRDNEDNYTKLLITKDDIEWKNLSNSQKQLLDFVNSTQEQIFNDPKSHLNKIVYKDDNGKAYNVLDFYNKQISENGGGFRYHKGWFPKTSMTEAEINKKHGGRLKLSTLKEKLKISLTDFLENNFEGINQYGIPLKYLGSDSIVKSGNYSSNLEQNFLVFMKHFTLKEQLDDVFAVSQGIKAIHEMSEDKKNNILFKQTLDFIDDRVLADLVGRTHKQVLFDVPFLLNKKGQKLDIYKLIAFGKKLATFSIMGFSPFRGLKNGLFASMVNYRNARINWIGDKFLGLEGDEINYSPEDLLKANKIVTSFMGETMKGTYRNHKLWHLAKQSRYLTHDTLEKSISTYVTKGNTSLMDSALAWYSIPEEWNSLSVLVAQMLHMKTKDGKSVYDNYELVDGQLIWNGGVRGYVDNAAGEKTPLKGLNSLEFGKMRRVYERLHGQYRQDERATMELYVYGNLIMMFTRHVATYYRNNFGTSIVDPYQGKYVKKGTTKIKENGIEKEEDVYEWVSQLNKGRYRILWEWMMNIRGSDQWTELEKRSALEGGYNIISSVMFAALMALVAGLVFDDDDEDSPQQKLISSLVRDYRSPIDPGAALGLSGNKGGNVLSNEISEIFTSFQTVAWSMIAYNTGIMTEDQAKTNQGYYKGERRFMNRLPFVRNMVKNIQMIENDEDRYIFDIE